mgnify:CR=1 FL=1
MVFKTILGAVLKGKKAKVAGAIKELIKKNFSSDEQDKCWEYWVSNTNDLENTLNTDVWNAKPNFTCRNYCAVLSCSHNGRGE